MRRHRHSTPKTHNCAGFQGLHAPCPPLAALIFLAGFEVNSRKCHKLRADEYLHPTPSRITTLCSAAFRSDASVSNAPIDTYAATIFAPYAISDKSFRSNSMSDLALHADEFVHHTPLEIANRAIRCIQPGLDIRLVKRPGPGRSSGRPQEPAAHHRHEHTPTSCLCLM
jgi:hypothetical protein